jgi:hypothetical protein
MAEYIVYRVKSKGWRLDSTIRYISVHILCKTKYSNTVYGIALHFRCYKTIKGNCIYCIIVLDTRIYVKLLYKYLVKFICGNTVLMNLGVLYSFQVKGQVVENLLATRIKER